MLSSQSIKFRKLCDRKCHSSDIITWSITIKENLLNTPIILFQTTAKDFQLNYEAGRKYSIIFKQ